MFYPVAASAGAALADLNLQLLRVAARQSDARRMAGRDVHFRLEFIGDHFIDRDQAFARIEALIGWGVPLSALAVVPVFDGPRRRKKHLTPPTSDRRWPAPDALTSVRFRVSLSFWCYASREAAVDQPRKVGRAARRRRQIIDPLDLLRRANSPLGPAVPQLELDIGLFEVRPPDQPDILIADE